VSTTPSLDAFLAAARREFAFLISDFGFAEQSLPNGRNTNPFKVAYVNHSTRVTVEGINWGVNTHVMLHSVSPASDVPPRVPLWAIVELRATDEPESPAGQIAQLHRDAELLRRHAFDVLHGDFGVFPAASRVVENHAATLATPKAAKFP
jgi:hypothetical protein